MPRYPREEFALLVCFFANEIIETHCNTYYRGEVGEDIYHYPRDTHRDTTRGGRILGDYPDITDGKRREYRSLDGIKESVNSPPRYLSAAAHGIPALEGETEERVHTRDDTPRFDSGPLSDAGGVRPCGGHPDRSGALWGLLGALLRLYVCALVFVVLIRGADAGCVHLSISEGLKLIAKGGLLAPRFTYLTGMTLAGVLAFALSFILPVVKTSTNAARYSGSKPRTENAA